MEHRQKSGQTVRHEPERLREQAGRSRSRSCPLTQGYCAAAAVAVVAAGEHCTEDREEERFRVVVGGPESGVLQRSRCPSLGGRGGNFFLVYSFFLFFFFFFFGSLETGFLNVRGKLTR